MVKTRTVSESENGPNGSLLVWVQRWFGGPTSNRYVEKRGLLKKHTFSETSCKKHLKMDLLGDYIPSIFLVSAYFNGLFFCFRKGKSKKTPKKWQKFSYALFFWGGGGRWSVGAFELSVSTSSKYAEKPWEENPSK